MAELKGTRTEANLADRVRRRVHGAQQVHALSPPRRKRTAMCRLRKSSRKPPQTRRSTRKSGSSCSTAASTTPQHEPQGCRRGRKLRVDRHVCQPSPREAREEGFDHIADLFEMVGAIEKEHEERYRRLLEERRGQAGLFPRRRLRMAVLQLRTYRGWQTGARGLPGLRAS